ncbi:ankyrin repeat domain-containing protein [Trinickia fusca]|uniref:Ankyrin repeat domain-containing protein n=2 Tax=Trinickia fusca TaxID=2419777 RepID=A0A494XT80_9BURK|nr:ankyrin repeat domain-containing protein [Trinickia fusca]
MLPPAPRTPATVPTRRLALRYRLHRVLLGLASGMAAVTLTAHAAGADNTVVKAVKFDDVKEINKQLAKGLDPNATDPQGMPLIVLAAREKSDKVAAVLAANPKTDVDQLDRADENAMMLASLNGDITIVKLLIDKDAEINKKGWAPLHYAAANGHDDIAQLLLDRSAYIDAASPNGTTPLMMAARGNHASTIKLLLAAGADASLKNQLGLTALDFAKQYHAKDATDVLEAVAAETPKNASPASSTAPDKAQNGAK